MIQDSRPDPETFNEAFAQLGTSSSTAGGADVIYGGRGRDWIFGGAGDDFLDAGADDDVAMGEAGADILIGGTGNDILVGDNPATVAAADEGGDYLDGGAGNGGAQCLPARRLLMRGTKGNLALCRQANRIPRLL